MPVMKMSEVSGTPADAAPVLMLTVPLAGEDQVFSTQVEMPGLVGFGTGSGVPKLQPVLVQSGAVLLTGGAVEVGPRLQMPVPAAQLSLQAPPAAHASANRLLEPSGTIPSGTVERPPPMFRPPQWRVRRAPPAELAVPHWPVATRLVNWRKFPPSV